MAVFFTPSGQSFGTYYVYYILHNYSGRTLIFESKSFSNTIGTYCSILPAFITGSLDRSAQDRTIVPATAVPEAWSEYLRENISPRGWLAVWDLKNPEQREVPVCVDVVSVDFKEFEAKIQG